MMDSANEQVDLQLQLVSNQRDDQPGPSNKSPQKIAHQFFEDPKKMVGMAKHGILTGYLGAWLAKLCLNQFRISGGNAEYERVIYVDGFAGPGFYANKKDYGSPALAYELVLTHKSLSRAARPIPEIYLIFIEKDKANCFALLENMKLIREKNASSKHAHLVRYMVIQGEFAKAMPWIMSAEFEFPEESSDQIFKIPEELNTVESLFKYVNSRLESMDHSQIMDLLQKISFIEGSLKKHPPQKFITRKTPLLVFVDPFGYNGAHMPMALMRDILSCSDKSEILINIMSGFLRRFFALDSRTIPINLLTGVDKHDASWKPIVLEGNTSDEKVNNFLSYYSNQISKGFRGSYTPWFEMRNETNNALVYHLFFVTRHPKSFESMKVAMSKLSHHYDKFGFSGFNEKRGKDISKDIPVATLRKRIVEKFKHSPTGHYVTGEEISEYLNYESSTLTQKYRNILKKALQNYRMERMDGGTRAFDKMCFDFTTPKLRSVSNFAIKIRKPAQNRSKQRGGANKLRNVNSPGGTGRRTDNSRSSLTLCLLKMPPTRITAYFTPRNVES